MQLTYWQTRPRGRRYISQILLALLTRRHRELNVEVRQMPEVRSNIAEAHHPADTDTEPPTIGHLRHRYPRTFP